MKISNMLCVILVGGEGRRLRSVHKNKLPKPMVFIENKPFLYYQIGLLAKKGFRKFLLCTGIMSSIIEERMTNGSRFGVRIFYSKENRPLGTGGAVKNARRFLNKPFFLLNGDTYLDIDYNSFLRYHIKKSAELSIAVAKQKNRSSCGAVKMDDGNRVVDFSEKKRVMEGFVSAGAYIVSPAVLNFIPKGRKISFECRTIPLCVKNGIKVYGYTFKGGFYDIGTPVNYRIFKDFIKSRRRP